MSAPNLSISSIEIPVSNLERAILWYEQALAFSCEWSDSHHAMLVHKTNSRSPRVLLVETNDPTRLKFNSTNTNLIHSVIDFETEKLEEAHAHLSACIPDLEPIPTPANDWAPRGFGFSDSEGNRLAIFSYDRQSNFSTT
jgi:predicted enzyme related to lactoylglutathione lyase